MSTQHEPEPVWPAACAEPVEEFAWTDQPAEEPSDDDRRGWDDEGRAWDRTGWAG